MYEQGIEQAGCQQQCKQRQRQYRERRRQRGIGDSIDQHLHGDGQRQ